MLALSSTLRARFDAKTARADSGCLLFTGCTDSYGYGLLRVGQGQYATRRTHIVAWFLHTGQWPDACLLHACDTPLCCEIGHLTPGSRADNNADRDAKGRHISLRGGSHGNACLSDTQAAEIRRRLAGAGRGMVRQLAWEYGVSDTAISRIKTGIGYRVEG